MNFKVKYLKQGEIFNANINLIQIPETGESSLSYRDEDNQSLNYINAHLYSSFLKLREDLLRQDKLLLCKGCVLNVHPSGRQLVWNTALILVKGKFPNPYTDSVIIFDEELDVSKLATIQEQKNFYKEWLKSTSSQPLV